MQRYVLTSMATLLLWAVTACTQVRQVQATAPTADRVSVGECPFIVNFLSKPVLGSTTDDATLTKYAVFENAHVKQALLCACDDKLNAENMTRSDADAISDFLVRKKGGDMVTISSEFFPAGEFGRELKYEGRFPKSIQGPVRSSARIIFVGQCVSAFVSNNLESEGQKETVRFLASIASLQQGSPAATSVITGPSSGTDPSVRLKLLEDAYRQNLLTPSEYQAKRKAILDAM